ncbi:MAG: transglutaminase-like domain-containing protein [Bacillota bacterium]
MRRVLRFLAGVVTFAIALTAMPSYATAVAQLETTTAAVQSTTSPQASEAPPAQPAPATQPVVASRIVEVRTSITVRNVLPDAAKNLVIVLPPTVTDKVGTQRVLDVTYINEPTSTRETPAGREAIYQVAEVPGFATLTFEQIYTVELLGTAEQVMEEKVDPRYLAPEAGVESDNAAIRAAALRVTADKETTTEQAEALIRFVVDRLDYDLNAASRNRGALAGFESRVGVCTEYAGLFVAMARAAGIPARLVYGWARNTGLEGALNAQNRHVWAEYYDAEKGWVAVDPTFAEVQEDVLAFDAQNHIAQDLTNDGFSASFGGRGLLSIVTNQTLTQLSTARWYEL